MYPPEGNFTIAKNGKTFKILPVICGERSFPSEDGSPLTGETIVHNWIKKSVEETGPFDLLAHPQSQADVDFSDIGENPSQALSDMFGLYYEAFFPYLSENALIVSSDINMSYVARKDGKGIANEVDEPAFTYVASKE